ncbi:lipopolysaccharide biosynthesis protein [Pedobacter cryotolerans]|uniref:Lipopolysaccharide biosynthesis protein n=1 Tax=Pedobacter cryotolerans TaxID=2571270 RepID=A0A4U1C850_9SPHI|nr:lipopolysaccharide biosynthesis protein [Pedobacter cryotolerans]TKB99654.1 lipopolysaccharide biosynthesis protein [Pedobacter cryotolerans]
MSLTSKLKNIHFLSLMGTGGMSVLTFFFTAILYRSLNIKEIGIWFFFQTSLSFLDTFRQGFLTTAFIKFYSGSTKERGKEVIGSTWIIASIITLVMVVINLPLLFFLNYFTDESLNYFFKYFSLNLVCSLPMIIAMCITQSELRFDRLLYIKVVQVTLLIFVVLGLIFFKQNNLQNLMMANVFATATTSLFTIITGWSGIRMFFSKSKSCIKELFNFGKYTVGTSISSNLFGITDTFIINFMLGPSAIAVYNLGRRLMEVVEIPIRSFVATALPSLSKAYNDNDKSEVIKIMKKYIGIITIGLIPALIIAIIFVDFALGIIGGGQYQGTPEGEMAANVFRLSALFALLYPADRFMSVTLDAIHMPQINFMKVIVMLVLSIAADFVGIGIFGNVYGIVIASIVPTTVAILISKHYIQKDYLRFSLLNSYNSGFNELKLIWLNFFKKKSKTTRF